MAPLPGLSESGLPGEREWKKEQEYLVQGIPISAEAMSSLAKLAAELELSIPW